MVVDRQAPGSMRILQAVLPDLDQRVGPFTVLTAPADAAIRLSFHEYLAALLPPILAALPPLDLPAIARTAHSLKGMGGAVGYPEISVLGDALERAALAGQDARVRQLIEALAAWQAAEWESPPC